MRLMALGEMLKLGAVLGLSFYLLGCASSVKTASKVAEVLYDPDIQVGSNEMQPSGFSVAVLTENANTTVSETLKRSIFSSKGPKDSYLVNFFELGKSIENKLVEGAVDAAQIKKILSGSNEASHKFYLKLNGYKFIKHFPISEDTDYLMAAVHFEEPKCTVWSALKPVKSIGEEYNFYFQGSERWFLFKSDLELSAPGEDNRLDNRFVGECLDQFNALAGQQLILDPPIEKAKKVVAVVPAVKVAEDQVVKIYPPKSKPKSPPVKYKKAKKQKIKTTNDIIDVLVKKDIKRMVLSPKELKRLPSYVDGSKNLVYLVSGVGIVNTTSDSLNIRKAPGTSNVKVAAIRKGAFVQVQRFTPNKEGWLFIESEGVKSGWVSEKLVNWKRI